MNELPKKLKRPHHRKKAKAKKRKGTHQETSLHRHPQTATATSPRTPRNFLINQPSYIIHPHRCHTLYLSPFPYPGPPPFRSTPGIQFPILSTTPQPRVSSMLPDPVSPGPDILEFTRRFPLLRINAHPRSLEWVPPPV